MTEREAEKAEQIEQVEVTDTAVGSDAEVTDKADEAEAAVPIAGSAPTVADKPAAADKPEPVAADTLADEEVKRNHRKVRQGTVVSATADKTCVVEVRERKPHPIYGKMMTRSKKFHAHDEANTASLGDVVTIMETRPISRLKRWRLLDIVEKAK